MAEIVTEDFRKSLRSSPTGNRKNGTMFDDLYSSMETSQSPLDKIVQTIAEYHGPYSGGSSFLANFGAFLLSDMGSTQLQSQVFIIARQALNVINALEQTPPSSVGRTSNQPAAVMPAPMLREFVNRSQKLHPAVNMYIQNNIDTFPYFQQISEDVGSYATIVSNRTSIDPMKWPMQDGVNCVCSTNSRLLYNTSIKLPNNTSSVMDNSYNMTNTLFLRAMPKQNNMSFMNPEYSDGSPKAHGHNFAMDVFNSKRECQSRGPAMAAVLGLGQDRLRLINKYFCVKELVRYDVEGFKISMNEGPNGEPMVYVVDNSSRPMFDNETTNEITDPTNDNVTGTKEEFKCEEQ
jgi:hypothetical protein